MVRDLKFRRNEENAITPQKNDDFGRNPGDMVGTRVENIVVKFQPITRQAAYYNKQQYLPGNVLFWSFDIVERLNRAGRSLTPWNDLLYSSRRFQNISPFLSGRSSYLAKEGFFSKKNLERSYANF